MAPARPIEDPQIVREQILDAAESRFEHFGYRKTTMTEVAEDVGMSAANLYRYFDNKQDIVVACASRCMADRVQVLREEVAAGDSAYDKLRRMFLETVRYTHQMAADRPRINELVEEITSNHPDVVQTKIHAIESMIADIIQLGNRRGEFDVTDIQEHASAIRAALVLFEVPIFVGLMSRAVFEQRAHALLRLLYSGLVCGAKAPAGDP